MTSVQRVLQYYQWAMESGGKFTSPTSTETPEKAGRPIQHELLAAINLLNCTSSAMSDLSQSAAESKRMWSTNKCVVPKL